MVFNALHCIPSFVTAILILMLFLKFSKQNHKEISIAIVVLGIFGLIGYLSAGRIRFFPLDIFTFHTWIGLATLILSLYLVINGLVIHKKHCNLSRIIAAIAAIALLTGLMLFFGITFK